MRSYDWPNVRARLAEAIQILPNFARHPVRGMRTLPDWDWLTLLTVQAGIAALTAFVANLIQRKFVLMLTSLVVVPVTHAVLTACTAGFFFCVSKFAFKRDVPFRQVYLNVVFAALPAQLVLILTPLVPPLMLAGSLASGALIYVGLVENLRMPRVATRNVLVGVFAIYTALWVNQVLRMNFHQVRLKERATPESMDILERELNPGGGDSADD